MTSACSRWSHPPNAAISNWNRSTPRVYATGADRPVKHYGMSMIQITNILCPSHFSEWSRHALNHAAAIAGWYDARVTVVHVFRNRR